MMLDIGDHLFSFSAYNISVQSDKERWCSLCVVHAAADAVIVADAATVAAVVVN